MADDLTFKVEIEPGVIQSMGDQASGILKRIGFRLQQEMLLSMTTQPKTGRIYRRGKTSLHQASAPGEAPAVDTGALAGTLNVQSPRYRQIEVAGPLLVSVRIPAEYATYLEFGTRRMSPRPYVQPAIDKVSRDQQFGGILSRARG